MKEAMEYERKQQEMFWNILKNKLVKN
jgi:hypothetical protein